MKQMLVVVLSLVALLFGAARSARANDIVDFQPNQVTVAQVDPRTDERSDAAEPEQIGNSGAIDFTPAPRKVQPVSQVVPFARKPVARSSSRPGSALQSPFLQTLFQGGSNSLVAKAVGSAEGTRTPEGGKTWAYYGHVDPGNGRWNLGSFSYQHEASSPEDADERQLARLQRQFHVIVQIAATNGLKLNLEEKLNAIDLANQAPLAALDQGGYVERLRQAQAEGFRGSDAVLRARTLAFINPRTNRWDAPGLGNTETSISRDQQRRQSAISEAIVLHAQKTGIKLADNDLPSTSNVKVAAAGTRKDAALQARFEP